MVIEYIRYTVAPGQAEDLQAAYRRAGRLLDADPHCLGWELARGVEEGEHVVVRIEWDSVSGHEQGFRASAGFREFFAEVKPFFGQIQEMKHYEVSEGSAHD